MKQRPPLSSVLFQQTAKEMRRSSVQFYSKQHHTTSLLDTTDSMRNLYQQRYWTSRTDEMTSVKETPPHLPRLNRHPEPHLRAQTAKIESFAETMDQKTDLTKLWRTIKGLDSRAKRETENEEITFNTLSSSKQLASKFNQQFNTSKLGRHTASSETQIVTRETKRKPLEMARTFTADREQSKAVEIERPLDPTRSVSRT